MRFKCNDVVRKGGGGRVQDDVRIYERWKETGVESITGLYRQSLLTVTAPIGPRTYRVACRVCGWAVEGMSWKWAVESAEGHEAGHAGEAGAPATAPGVEPSP